MPEGVVIKTYVEIFAADKVEASELARVDLLFPSSKFLWPLKAFCELPLLIIAEENIERRLERLIDSLIIGFSSGKQAPTIPSDDSTIGQYIVGV